MERLEEAGLREKCKFVTSQVDYLSHTLPAEEVKPNESKIVAVKEFSSLSRRYGLSLALSIFAEDMCNPGCHSELGKPQITTQL